MSTLPNPEKLTGQYAGFVDELQQLFAFHGIHYGLPEDITSLSEHLSTPGDFPAELASLSRSFIYREHGVLPRTELLEIIVLAVGGARIQDFAQQYHAEVRQIYSFLGEVARNPMQTGAGQPPAFTPPPQQSEAAAESLQAAPQGPSGVLAPATSPATHRAARRWLWVSAAVLFVLAMTWFMALRRPRFDRPASTTASPSASPRASQPLSSQVSAGAPAAAPAEAPRAAPSPLGPPRAQHAAPRPAPGIPSQTGSPSAAASRGEPLQPSATAAARGPSVAPTPSPIPSQITNQTALQSPVPALAAAGAKRPAAAPRTSRKGAPVGSYGVSTGVMAAHLISAPEPQYPKLARLTRIEGPVMLQAVVGTDGRVSVVHVLSGHHLLRGAATRAVRTWRYRPYTIDGRPVEVATIITVNFQLNR